MPEHGDRPSNLEAVIQMITVPYQRTLVQLVRDTLNTVAPTLGGGGWERTIGDAIEQRLKALDPTIHCYCGRKSERPPHKNELLFDFISGVPIQYGSHETFLMQPLVVGESEAAKNLAVDFEKLLLVDALVYYFVFNDWVREHGDDLRFFREICNDRRRLTGLRGAKPSPAFILARYAAGTRTFEYGFIADSEVVPH